MDTRSGWASLPAAGLVGLAGTVLAADLAAAQASPSSAASAGTSAGASAGTSAYMAAIPMDTDVSQGNPATVYCA